MRRPSDFIEVAPVSEQLSDGFAATRVTVPCGVLPLPRVEERTYMKQASCLRSRERVTHPRLSTIPV